MDRKIYLPLRLIAAAYCLVIGLLLWNNLTLHFTEIEEILPSLKPTDLVSGKELFLVLIAGAMLLGGWMTAGIHWKKLRIGHRPFRSLIACLLFLMTFIPLFWVRFGLAAWIIILFITVSFFLCGIGILILSAGSANYLKIPLLQVPESWKRLSPWLPGLLLFAVALYFSHYCFGFLPHIEDSIAQVLQARIFATGHVSAEPFLPKEFFFYGFMADQACWFSHYPPGHPLLLTLGVFAGAPYLVNPLLGLACVILLYYLLRELEGNSVARWGAWAMALSPFVFFMSAGFMNHTTALASSLLGWLALKKGEGGKQG